MFPSFLTTEGELNKDLLSDIMELDAMRMELSTQIGISKEYRAQRLGWYTTYYLNIWDRSGRMAPEFVKELKIKFFKPWMVTSPYLFKKRVEGKEVWYFKHPKTGREYYLPEEIIERFSQNGKG